jgi:hypothetical protein
MNLAFYNGLFKSPLRPPFSKGGNGGISANALLEKEIIEKSGSNFQKAKVLPQMKLLEQSQITNHGSSCQTRTEVFHIQARVNFPDQFSPLKINQSYVDLATHR